MREKFRKGEMGMQYIRSEEGQSYMAPGHFGGEFISKIDDTIEGNDHLTLNVSHFQPGGGCEYGSFPAAMPNLIYYVLNGQITVTTDTETFEMKKGDCVIWNGGDVRGFVNEGETVTDLLVIIGK